MNPFCIPFSITNMGGALLAMDLGFMGPNYPINTACATGNYCLLKCYTPPSPSPPGDGGGRCLRKHKVVWVMFMIVVVNEAWETSKEVESFF